MVTVDPGGYHRPSRPPRAPLSRRCCSRSIPGGGGGRRNAIAPGEEVSRTSTGPGGGGGLTRRAGGEGASACSARRIRWTSGSRGALDRDVSMADDCTPSAGSEPSEGVVLLIAALVHVPFRPPSGANASIPPRCDHRGGPVLFEACGLVCVSTPCLLLRLSPLPRTPLCALRGSGHVHRIPGLAVRRRPLPCSRRPSISRVCPKA
jgi:hypothetical protein